MLFYATGLPLQSVVTFYAEVVCANTSDVVFHWLIPDLLDSSGRGLTSVTSSFTVAGVHQLTLTVWNVAVGVRSEFRRTLCANETVPDESLNLKDLPIEDLPMKLYQKRLSNCRLLEESFKTVPEKSFLTSKPRRLANETVLGIFQPQRLANQRLANETVPEEPFNLEDLTVGISRIGAPYLPAGQDIVFFPVIRRCRFICSFQWQMWDSSPMTEMHGFKVQHRFRNPGVFNVSLAVNRMSIWKIRYTTVLVQKVIEKASLRAAVEAARADEPIEFIVATKPDEKELGKLTYHWLFYDEPSVNYTGNSSTMTFAFHREGIRHLSRDRSIYHG